MQPGVIAACWDTVVAPRAADTSAIQSHPWDATGAPENCGIMLAPGPVGHEKDGATYLE